MDIGPILAQAAKEGGARIARGSDVYIARAGVHVTDNVLVCWPQVGAIAGIIPKRCSGRLHACPVRR
jgi:hypothetical protein